MIKNGVYMLNKLLIFLLDIIAKKIISKTEKNNEIDLKIFLDSDKIINESTFSALFNHAYNLYLTKDDYDLITKYIEYFNTPNNKRQISKIYNDKTIKNNFEEFFNLFLKTFNGTEWFLGRSNRFVVEPDLKRNNHEEYLDIMNKIKDLSFEGSKAYMKYRKSIKKNFGA